MGAGTSRLLVTGGNGFIGRAVCPVLREAGFDLTVAFRSAVPHPRNDVEAVGVGEIDGVTDWSGALKTCRFVLHLAGMAHVSPEATAGGMAACRRVNVEGTLNLARQAARSGVERFVFVSTVKVMGEGRATAYHEDEPPRPAGTYAHSKLEAENGLRALAQETGMELVILRPPLVYGPDAKANFFALLRAVDRGLPLPFGAIANRRSLIFVGNLADAIGACLTRPEAAGRTFFVSDGDDVSTADLARSIARAMGRRPRLIRVPPVLLRALAAPAGRREALARLSASLFVDTRAIREAIGWRPPFTLAEGLTHTVEWYRHR